ncbi:hypothetical protein V6N13_077498 [Hibiscus sabdariffa]|uniref:Uncharacterized protein n=1 Tax=Hibiscus sabdariffa TaxID=183260 RepID=A0ABR2CPQ9_9ROSI
MWDNKDRHQLLTCFTSELAWQPIHDRMKSKRLNSDPLHFAAERKLFTGRQSPCRLLSCHRKAVTVQITVGHFSILYGVG